MQTADSTGAMKRPAASEEIANKPAKRPATHV